MPRIPVPSRLGRFEILELIGGGLTGEVYKARYSDGTLVALKLCIHEGDRTVFGYFTNEQLLLREIALHRLHPHIVEYITCNLNRPPYYLATRLVEGACSLAAILGGMPVLRVDGSPQPAAFIVRVVSQVASALDYLHNGHPNYSPIVHRDVKPANILIDASGNAVLIDLSIASHPHYALEDERLLGTPGYMAPEQYLGQEVPASDQFALAVVALEMLSGRRVLPDRASVAKRRLAHWHDTSHGDINRLLGKRTHTADVLVRALAYSPGDRYESCEVFADQLRRALAQDGEPVHEQALPERSSTRVVRSHPSVLPWLGVGAAVMIALAVLVTMLLSAGPTALVTGSAPQPVAVAGPPGVALQNTRVPVVSQSTLVAATTQHPHVPADPQQGEAVTMVQREPLRVHPSTDAPIVTWMPAGARAERTGNEQPVRSFVWYEVRFQDQVGWCRSLYCKP